MRIRDNHPVLAGNRPFLTSSQRPRHIRPGVSETRVKTCRCVRVVEFLTVRCDELSAGLRPGLRLGAGPSRALDTLSAAGVDQVFVDHGSRALTERPELTARRRRIVVVKPLAVVPQRRCCRGWCRPWSKHRSRTRRLGTVLSEAHDGRDVATPRRESDSCYPIGQCGRRCRDGHLIADEPRG